MSNTKIKAAQFHGVVGHGTNGYFLVSDGNGGMSWVSNIINPTITNVDYPGTATAADPAGGETITLTGTGFKTGAAVTIGGTAAGSVSFVSATELTVTTPAKTAGDYDIVVTNTDGGSATSINGISYNGIPAWTTAAGSLGTFDSDTTISTITLQASEPDSGTITFSITNGTLPTGLSLSGADIDGTTTLETADTLYTFTVTATDDESQATPRTFTITVKKELISSENFTINTYTGNGSTQAIEGKIGTAASFNGSSSKIVLPTSTFSPSTFTLSAWCNVTSDTDENTILELLDNQSYPNHTNIVLSAGSTGTSSRFLFRNYLANQYDYSPTGTVQKNVWKHYAMTYDGSTVKSYINGSLVDSASFTLSNTVGTISSIQLGLSSGNRYLNGKIDQVRIFNKALSSSEVTTLYGENNTSSTKSTTDIFDDGSGVALYEFEKGAIDTGGTNGYIGRAGVFNGSSSIIRDIPNSISTSLKSNNAFTYSIWIKFNSLSSQSIIAFFNDITSTVTFNGTNFEAYIYNSSTQQKIVTNPATVTTGVWYNVVFKGDSNGIFLYVNNNTPASTSWGGDWFIYTNTTYKYNAIGARQNSGGFTDYVDGQIDQVRIFNKALSSSEVTTLYGETSASATKSTADIFDDSSGVALYELEGNANDTGGNYNGTATNVSYAYDGTPTNVSFVGTSFQPDLVWIKDRTSANSHILQDSVRGANKALLSNATSAEITSTDFFTSFDSNGFTLPSNTGQQTNKLNNNYVAWMWKAGGSAVSNTSGSITSQVSANQDAGFSVVKYDGTGNTATVGHGLSAAPELILIKNTNSSNNNWGVGGSILGATETLYLNLSNAQESYADPIIVNTQTSTTFSLGSDGNRNGNNNSHIAYCFHSVDGYQKVGSYTGNGSSGNSINVGFDPRFIMFKNSSASGQWWIHDAIRGDDKRLFAEVANAETTSGSLTTSSTGFTLNDANGNLNANGNTYIYLAIA